ncbi:hypothetical protein MKW98_029780 [Papaver atlanticum]|uniref:ESF1 RRM domain-containing protein n=1 Tax=Papaver atlanticum TaxID=357466 RepID=A0AAD4T4H3_9MAGN|nr:hypothetical protein MKW98_029780 [Papaver atlanticum]
MNVSIIDPLQGDFPEVIEEFLEHGVMKCIAFNRRGTLLAAGCSDGSCIIWDFETRGIAKELKDSECKTPVTSVCWSKYGHHVLVAAIDKSLTLWNVVNGEKVTRITLQQTTLQARLHPGSHTPSVCLACPLSSAPLLVELTTGNTKVLPVSLSDLDSGAYGDLIYVGNSKGEILIIDYKKVELYGVVINSGAANHLSQKDGVKALDELCTSFDDLQGVEKLKAVGSKCLALSREFQDSINRIHWKAPCFSGDGEWVVGASGNKGEHKIYIWDRAGHLVKILEGPKEALTDLAWHPVNPIAVSVSISGLVYIWAKDYTENWSAFAPDFKELEENEEYVEREDEFDLMPETEKVKHSGVNEDEDVDILTVEKESALSDSDMSQEELCFLPAVPFPDVLDLQDKYVRSSSKMIDSNHSGSPLSNEAGQDGHGVNLDSSPVDALGNLIADDTGATTASMKRKRKLSEKGSIQISFMVEEHKDYRTSRGYMLRMLMAADLFVVMSSFLPKSGKIVSIAVYPSEFGLKRTEEEAVKGPVRLFDDGKVKSDDDDDDDHHEIDEEKLRAYEKSRLRYYYAVVECDSSGTADYLYKNCDGIDFERTSNVLDLRCLELTWDEDEPQRIKALKRTFNADQQRIKAPKRTFNADQLAESEMNAYLASDVSDDDEDEIDAQDDQSKEKLTKAEKYRVLFERGDEGSDGGDDEDGNKDMEVTFNTGLEDLNKRILEKKKDKDSETVWNQYLRKKSEKKKARKNASKHSSEDESSGSGRDEAEQDDFFIDESSIKFSKGGKSNMKPAKRNWNYFLLMTRRQTMV